MDDQNDYTIGPDLLFDRELPDRVTLDLGEGVYLASCDECGQDFHTESRYGCLCAGCSRREHEARARDECQWYAFPARRFRR